MPDASRIVAGLSAVANENLRAAFVWHALLGAAIVAIWLGWRPSRKIAALLLSCLPASVSAFAFQYGNPFNGVAFGLLTGVLLFNGLGADVMRLRQPTTATAAIGSGLIAFGWLYPHFLQSHPMFMYMFVAPTGLIPCPTLAVLTGFTVLLPSGVSRSWSVVLGVFGLFYGAFGMLRLGVWLDAGLLGGALYLLTLRKGSLRPVLLMPAASIIRSLVSVAVCVVVSVAATPGAGSESVLANRLLVTWYGNPHSARMGVLRQKTGAARADALRHQAAAYQPLTTKKTVLAYHLVAVVAQAAPGMDGMYRRRESAAVIQGLLDEARANGFRLVLDIQSGRSSVRTEVEALRPFLEEPDVYLALDPEFALSAPDIPGRRIGAIRAAEINAVLDLLEQLIVEGDLPAKVLIVHQFRGDMLPDKAKVRTSSLVDLVLNMDGFGPQTLKTATYRAIDRQGRFAFAGFKLFYQQDAQLFSPAQVMSLSPVPSVVIYQ